MQVASFWGEADFKTQNTNYAIIALRTPGLKDSTVELRVLPIGVGWGEINDRVR